MADISEQLKIAQQLGFLGAGGGRKTTLQDIAELLVTASSIPTNIAESRRKTIQAKKEAIPLSPIGDFYGVPSADQESAMKSIFESQENKRTDEARNRIRQLLGEGPMTLEQTQETAPRSFESPRTDFEKNYGVSPDLPTSFAVSLMKAKTDKDSVPRIATATDEALTNGLIRAGTTTTNEAVKLAAAQKRAETIAGNAEARQDRSFKEARARQAEGQEFQKEQGAKQTAITFTKSLQDDYVKASGDFQNSVDAYNRVIQSYKDPSPAGDLALLFNYMKILDPKSTVRESEFTAAAQTGSLPQQIQATATKLIKGERLTPEQRRDFVRRASTLYKGAEKQQASIEKQFEQRAKKLGVDPSLIVLDYRSNLEEPSFESLSTYLSDPKIPEKERAQAAILKEQGMPEDQIIELLKSDLEEMRGK